MITDETRERARALRERAGQDYAQKWDFDELPHLVGVIESINEVVLEGEARVVVTIAEVEGSNPERYAVWLSQAALRARFEELEPTEGELVSIRYLGEAEHAERGKSPAKRFRVDVDRVGGSFSWDRHKHTARAAGNVPGEPLGEDEHAELMARYEEAISAGEEPAPVDPQTEAIPF